MFKTVKCKVNNEIFLGIVTIYKKAVLKLRSKLLDILYIKYNIWKVIISQFLQ